MASAMTKRCNRCGRAQPLESFARNCKMKDGRLNQCKECRPKVTPQARRRSRQRYREAHPDKVRARKALVKAVERGRLIKPPACQGCGKPFKKAALHGHHEDYSKPLDVAWLCRGCHQALHKEVSSAKAER